MTWQTWIVHLGWAIQCTVAIIVFLELLNLKIKRVYAVIVYVTGITLLHILRAYFFIYMPSLPSEETFFGVIIPLYTYLIIRFVSYEKPKRIVLWIVLIYTYSVLGHVLALVACHFILSESFYFDFVSNEVLFSTLIATVIVVSLYLLFYFALKHFIGRILTDIPNIIALILVLSGQLVYGLSQLLSFLSMNEQVNPQIAAGVVLMIIGNVVLLRILLTNSKKKEADDRALELQHLRELEQLHYASIESKQQELAKVRHDFYNQSAILQQLIIIGKTEHAEELLDEMKQSLISTTENQYSQNTIVNAVIIEKQKECDIDGITLETDILIDEKCNITPIHLCSIFTNLIDNAIKACRELPADKRKIEIRTALKGAYLHIKTVNPIPDINTGKPKRNGYGKTILSDIAADYKGNFTTGITDGMFIAMVSAIYDDTD